MDEAIDALARRGLGEHTGRIDAPGLKLVPSAPITDFGGAMKHPCDTGDGRLARRRISEVAAHDFDAERFQKLGPAIRPNQGSDPVALRYQPLGQMTSQ